MFLLLDECCSPSLVAVAENLGHTAQLTIHVAELGRQAKDQQIFNFARGAGAVLVTVNGADFIQLAAHRHHTGLIVLPSVGRNDLRPLFKSVLAAAEPLLAEQPDLVIEIDQSGQISSFRRP